MSLPSRLWIELTAADVARLDMAAEVAILPVAAVEQHGPHLPLGTDAMIMQGYLDRWLAAVPTDVPGLLLPIQTCGSSLEHADFPGTLSLAARTALAAWGELAASIARTGCRKLVLVNSHGGNSPVLDILAQELRARLKLLVVKASWQRFGMPEGLFSAVELAHGIHAGAIETSLMLAFRPDLVRRDALRAHEPASISIEARFARLRTGRPTGFGWMAQDLSASGAMGDATAATADKGEACAAHGVAAFIELLRDVAAFDTTDLAERS